MTHKCLGKDRFPLVCKTRIKTSRHTINSNTYLTVSYIKYMLTNGDRNAVCFICINAEFEVFIIMIISIELLINP